MTYARNMFTSLIIVIVVGIAPTTAGELSVFAASSLTAALKEIAKNYQSEYPDEQVLMNFSGSQALATQIEQGVPADLFLSANQKAVTRLQSKGLVEDFRPFLHNRLLLVTRNDLQPPMTRIEDLGRSELLVIIGNKQVPVGNYTRQLLSNLAGDPDYGPVMIENIKNNVVSEENKAKAIVAKLLIGEADAGIAYQSDFVPDRLTAVSLPEKHNPLATYFLAKVTEVENQADRFIALLASTEATKIFARYGFPLEEGN
jgi:molybdate transport system substrate-binding protein